MIKKKLSLTVTIKADREQFRTWRNVTSPEAQPAPCIMRIPPGVDHPQAPSFEVKNESSYTSAPPRTMEIYAEVEFH